MESSRRIKFECDNCGKIFEDYISNKKCDKKFCCRLCFCKSRIGRTPWNKGQRGNQVAWNKGLKGFLKGRKITWADKISLGKKNSLKSRLASQSAGQKMGIGNIGRKHTEQFKELMRNRWLGEKNPNWTNGKYASIYNSEWKETLKRSIRERDGYLCQFCGKSQIEEVENLSRKLSVHHIDYNKYNCSPDNLITLCNSCHVKTNTDRDNWIKYFNEK